VLDETPVLKVQGAMELWTMLDPAAAGLAIAVVAFFTWVLKSGSNQPTGPYELEWSWQEGWISFTTIPHYEGHDHPNGITCMWSERTAKVLGIINVTYEKIHSDDYNRRRRRKLEGTAIK
jgi:hypothetical protein